MELLLAITVGALYAAGFYMILRRSFVKIIIGLALLSHAANLFLFTVGGVKEDAKAPILGDAKHVETPLEDEAESARETDSETETEKADEHPHYARAEDYADPLPQALILTAIVIGFGVQAFTLVLFKRVYQTAGSDDLDQLKSSEVDS